MSKHRIDALGAHYIVEEIAPVLALMGDDMTPQYHDQQPRVYQLIDTGAVPVGNADVEREVLRIWRESIIVPQKSRVVRKPAKRSPPIHDAFWSGLEVLEQNGHIEAYGDNIVLHITKAKLAEATSHLGRDAMPEALRKNLKRNLAAYDMTIAS